MIVYIEYPKESTNQFLEIFNEFSNVLGFTVKIQKLVIFLYITMND